MQKASSEFELLYQKISDLITEYKNESNTQKVLYEQKVDYMKDHIHSKDRQISDLQKRVIELEKKIYELKHQKDLDDQRIENVKMQHAQEVRNLENQKSDRDRRIGELMGEKNKLEQQIKEQTESFIRYRNDDGRKSVLGGYGDDTPKFASGHNFLLQEKEEQIKKLSSDMEKQNYERYKEVNELKRTLSEEREKIDNLMKTRNEDYESLLKEKEMEHERLLREKDEQIAKLEEEMKQQTQQTQQQILF